MWKNIILLCFVILSLFIATEVGVRILKHPLYSFDETLGYTLNPNSVFTHKTNLFDATYHVNNLGYRGKAYNKSKTPGVYRIVLIGDSNSFGYGVNDDETFASIIDRRLSGVEVINLSVIGYGTDQEFLRLKKEGLSYQPDLVIWQVCKNDFSEITASYIYGRCKPFFILQDGRLILKNTYEKNKCNIKQGFIRCLLIPVRNWLARNSQAFHSIRNRYYGIKLRLKGQQRYRMSTGEGAFELFNAIIAEAYRELSGKGIKMIIVHWDKTLGEKINCIERSMGIQVIDLSSVITKNFEKISIREPGFWHPNKEGHLLIAEKLIEVITVEKQKKNN